jgi:hypothetical protein
MIEGYGVGGKVLIVSKEPQFIRDVCPYFVSSFILIAAHIMHVYTGNFYSTIWTLYIAIPISGFIMHEDN